MNKPKELEAWTDAALQVELSFFSCGKEGTAILGVRAPTEDSAVNGNLIPRFRTHSFITPGSASRRELARQRCLEPFPVVPWPSRPRRTVNRQNGKTEDQTASPETSESWANPLCGFGSTARCDQFARTGGADGSWSTALSVQEHRVARE